MSWSNTHSADLEESSSQYLSVANDAFDITTGTIQGWFKLESLPSVTGHIYGLIDSSNNASLQGFYLVVRSSDNKVEAGFGATTKITSSTALTAGVWVHITLAWNTSGSELIINGVSDGTGTAATLTAGNANLFIGNQPSAVTRYFDGKIDDVRIYTTKRTAANVLGDYQSALVGNESGLLAYWKLDNALTDSTSGGRTLTNNGTAVFSTDVAFPGTSTSTDTAGTPVEAVTFTTSIPITAADVAGTPVDTATFRFGWNNPSKNTASWTNQDKS